MKSKFILTLLLLPFLGFTTGCINSTNVKFEIPEVKKDSTYKVLIESDIIYGQGLSHVSTNSANATTMPLKLDIYSPENNIKNRPAFLFIHGGGFVGGSKKQKHIIRLANYYTSRGWVFISIDYRLKKHKGTIPKQWGTYADNVPKNKATQFMAIYPAIRDAKAALRWVVSNSKKYNIDTNFITVGGSSAGAIAAIALGISNTEDFRDEISPTEDSTLSSINLNQTYKIKTIVDLWGSKIALDAHEKIFNHQSRFDSNDPALLILHGTLDKVVPFSNAKDLKTIYDTKNIPVGYYPLEGVAHGGWNAIVNNKSLAELSFDFIVEQQKLNVN